MYLTTKQFTKILLTSHESHDEVLSALEFLYIMRKRLGRKMETEAYMQEIKKEYPVAYGIWSACVNHDKKKAIQIKQLIRTGKELGSDYTKQFSIHTGSEDISILTKKIAATFDKSSIIHAQNDTPELSIQGE